MCSEICIINEGMERFMNWFLLDQSGAASQAASTASGAAANAQQMNPWQMVLTIGIWVVVIVAAYFLFIRPQRKKQKMEEELRSSIEIGDEITTIGGIVGRVIAVRDEDETFIIETGSDKTRMRFKKWAIASVDTPDKNPKPAEKKKDEAASEEDDGKKKKKRRNKAEE